MEFVDYYKILELTKSASTDDVKKAYRKLARKYHPDLNPNDDTAKKKFQQINEANEVLSDPEKRKKYDQYGENWKQSEAYENASRQQQTQQNSQSYSQHFSDHDFSEYFESMFGGGGKSRQAKFRGQDYTYELHLNLTDVYTSHQQTLSVNSKNIRLTIPAGVENGQSIKIAGHGGEGANGGPKGDLYITFAINNNTAFKRDGNDLSGTVDVDLYTAILGGEITIDTLSGKVKLKVTPETQNNTKVKLKGKGFPVYKKEGTYGDLYLTYHVKTPRSLSDKEKELFNELAKLRNHGS